MGSISSLGTCNSLALVLFSYVPVFGVILTISVTVTGWEGNIRDQN